jgi:hypothetical protein
MGEEDQGSEIRVSNWTLATGTRPGERVPIDVGTGRTDAQPSTSLDSGSSKINEPGKDRSFAAHIERLDL